MYYSALFKNQAGRLSVKGFSIFCGLLIVEYKSDGILRPNDFIDLGFFSYKHDKATCFGRNETL